MSIKSFNETFGAVKANATAAKAGDKPKAKFWLNLGYQMEGVGVDGKDVFVSLPTGIPLDSQEPVATNSSNADFRALRSAQNNLLEQLMQYAESLEPGEERIIQLSVQLRRVREEEAPIAADQNKYAAKLTF